MLAIGIGFYLPTYVIDSMRLVKMQEEAIEGVNAIALAAENRGSNIDIEEFKGIIQGFNEIQKGNVDLFLTYSSVFEYFTLFLFGIGTLQLASLYTVLNKKI